MHDHFAPFSTIDQLAVNTIRTLAIDGIEAANSGHPGLPMGAAPMAYVLFSRFLQHQPKNPSWFNRDRFVLSAGHGSMLLYSLLHLFSYDLPIEELTRFRKWGSKTPGHPEYGHTSGVEMTTGPLGQGIASAVGMAMAERFLAARYNRPDHALVDHYTYALVGDGDLMEGIAYEATSLAGHQQLDKLIVLYDSNDISLDGPTSRAFTENVEMRFKAAGWHYEKVADGNNLQEIADAITRAKALTGKPKLIEVRTTIGYGSPGKQGTSKAHGSPLGSTETSLAKAAYGWDHEERFYVPNEVKAHLSSLLDGLLANEAKWNDLVDRYTQTFVEEGREFADVFSGKLPANWDGDLPRYTESDKELATRQASGLAINALAKRIPNLIGGSADLASSNETNISDGGVFEPQNHSGRNLWFGVREHAMGAILNGMALHGGLHVFGGTFMVFSDYLRPSMRLASLMKLPVVYVFTHDSIGVGEDGPTHQPVEQLAALRAMPNLITMRPGDANETIAAWHYAMAHRDRPVALALTRQKLPILPATDVEAMAGVERGGYILAKEAKGQLDAILIATGSEVSLALAAKNQLEAAGYSIRLVSLPAFRLFDEQDAAYKAHVLPKTVKARVGVEMALPFGWEQYLGDAGVMVSIDHFGASAPAEDLLKQFGFTVEHIIEAVKTSIERSGQEA